MSTYTQILYQIVFGTKNHERTMLESGRENLYKYIWGILENKNKKVIFRDEYIALLKAHGIEFDERYLL